MYGFPLSTSLIVLLLLVTLFSLIVNKGYSGAHDEVNGKIVYGSNDTMAVRSGSKKP